MNCREGSSDLESPSGRLSYCLYSELRENDRICATTGSKTTANNTKLLNVVAGAFSNLENG